MQNIKKGEPRTAECLTRDVCIKALQPEALCALFASLSPATATESHQAPNLQQSCHYKQLTFINLNIKDRTEHGVPLTYHIIILP
jgi:hypothetical protein